MRILQPVSNSSCLAVRPLGPNNLPTKLNWRGEGRKGEGRGGEKKGGEGRGEEGRREEGR